MRKIQYFEDEYGYRAIDKSTETTKIVVLEWQHPNYGYWADFGMIYKFAHETRAWVKTSCSQCPTTFASICATYPRFLPLLRQFRKKVE